MPLALAVHGGAWNIPDESVRASLDGVRAALESGWNALRERERYLRVRAGERDLVEKEFDPQGLPEEGSLGTVGAVALDAGGVRVAVDPGEEQP